MECHTLIAYSEKSIPARSGPFSHSLSHLSVMNRGIPPAMTELISVCNKSCVVFASFSECNSERVWSLYNTVWLMDSESGGPLADSV